MEKEEEVCGRMEVHCCCLGELTMFIICQCQSLMHWHTHFLPLNQHILLHLDTLPHILDVSACLCGLPAGLCAHAFTCNAPISFDIGLASWLDLYMQCFWQFLVDKDKFWTMFMLKYQQCKPFWSPWTSWPPQAMPIFWAFLIWATVMVLHIRMTYSTPVLDSTDHKSWLTILSKGSFSDITRYRELYSEAAGCPTLKPSSSSKSLSCHLYQAHIWKVSWSQGACAGLSR